MTGMGTHLATERVRLVTPRLQLARSSSIPTNEPLTKHRKDSDDTKTGVSPVSREQHGRDLLTGHAMSGV
jgi:hypothetical protein